MRNRKQWTILENIDTNDKPQRTVTTLELVFISFFCVSGGSFGLEDAVRGGYPLFSLVGLLIIPWIWSLPAALMTAELATAMPENGGKVIWTKKAFGAFWGFQMGYWSWLNSLADNALYPVMFVDYLSEMTGVLSPVSRFFVVFAFVTVLTVTNILGIQLVGKVSIVFALIVLSPFVILGLWGLPYLNIDALTRYHSNLGDGDWGLYLSVLLWNTSGWDSAGSLAGEIMDPQRTYPRGLLLALLLVVVIYIWPLSVAISIDQNYDQWYLGYFANVAEKLGGPSFKIFLTLVGLVSALGMFNVLLCTSARNLYALAPDDLLGWPVLAALHPKFNTPWISILVNAVGTMVLSLLPWQSLVEIATVLYSLSLILNFLAFIWLRFTQPSMERPYKIPMKTWQLILFVLPPIGLCVISILFIPTLLKLLSILCVLIGPILYGIVYWRRSCLARHEITATYQELERFFVAEESESLVEFEESKHD